LTKLILPYPSIDSYKEGEPVDNQEFDLGIIENLSKFSTVRAMIDVVKILNGTIYRLGICVPHICTAHEVEDIINKSEFN